MGQLPEISITKVRLPKNETIKGIIIKYNTKLNKTKKKKRTKKKQRPEYVALEQDIIQTLKINMKLDVYVQKFGYRSKVLGSLFHFKAEDGRYKEIRCNIAIFCYFNDSIYAITTNSAWKLVQNYRDPEFPQRIAARLLDKGGPKDYSKKPLFSQILKTSQRRRKGKKSTLDALNEPHISLNYVACLRENASIYDLDCFDKKTKMSPVNVSINYGSIRFQCAIKIDSLSQLIEHLHKIYNGDPTCTTKREEEEDSITYKQYLQVADEEVKTDLNRILLENLRKSIQNNDDNAMENFELMHILMDEFLDATQFTLISKKVKRKIEVDSVPNLKLVIKVLRDKSKTMFDGIRNAVQLQKFQDELSNIRINFKGKPDENEDLLWNFLEGMVTYNHLYYFRAVKNWFYISEDYYRHIQDEFVECLKDKLLDYDEEAQLKLEWKAHMDEEAYNNEYRGEENFLVCDRNLMKDTFIEVFDLLFYNSSTKTTYLYHVKNGFDQSTRVAQDQLCNAATIVQSFFKSKDNRILKQFHDKILKNYEDYNEKHGTSHTVPAILAKFDKFKEIMGEPKRLVFVCALKSNKLRKEQNLQNKIVLNNIENVIENLPKRNRTTLAEGLGCDSTEPDELSKNLFDKLIQSQYITEIDNENSTVREADVNSSLVLTTKIDFQTTYNLRKTANNIICDEILRPYRTHFMSLIAKFSVIKMKKEIEGKYNYTFKICEIMGDNKKKIKNPNSQDTNLNSQNTNLNSQESSFEGSSSQLNATMSSDQDSEGHFAR